MKKSLIWTTAGIAAVGFGVPAFAAKNDAPRPVAPAAVITVAKTPDIPASVAAPVNVAVTPVSVEDNPVSHDATDDDATENSVEDATENSVDDDATENTMEDVSGNCDEAEHANDATCTATGAVSTNDGAGNDNSGHGNGGSDDGSGHHGGGDDK